jgi:hypothetical protein
MKTVSATYIPSMRKKEVTWRLSDGTISEGYLKLADGQRAFAAKLGCAVSEIEWRYIFNGEDLTAKIDSAWDARLAWEAAEEEHKRVRYNVANEVREQGVALSAIGEVLGYQLSSVAMFLRGEKKPTRRAE